MDLLQTNRFGLSNIVVQFEFIFLILLKFFENMTIYNW